MTGRPFATGNVAGADAIVRSDIGSPVANSGAPAVSSPDRWQAELCSGATASRAGSSSAQRPIATGQRGTNGQSGGRLISDGGAPGIGRNGAELSASSLGSEPRRPSVYG